MTQDKQNRAWRSKLKRAALCAAFALPATISSQARGDEVPLHDVNGDGTVKVVAFGDSITYGVGDAYQPGEYVEHVAGMGDKGGYPDRVERYLGVPVYNEGIPGEELTVGGLERFPRQVAGSNFDIVIIMEGSNDAPQQKNVTEYAHDLQRMINVGVADGKEVVVMTVLPPVGLHGALLPFTEAYSRAARDLAHVNGAHLIDAERGFIDACPTLDQCELLNLPEGLHPNHKGYDALGQIVAAGLVGIDVTAPGSAAQISSALGLPQSDVIVGKN